MMQQRGESSAGPAGASSVRGRIERSLRVIRRRAKVMLVAQRVGLVAAWVVGLCVLAACVDYLLRTPSWLRGSVLFTGAFSLIWALWRVVAPALRFSPSLTEIALRIERSQSGRSAGLEGVLASGLELARAGTEQVEPVVIEAERRVGSARLGKALWGGQTVMDVAALAVVVTIGAAMAGSFPGLAAIGARRLFTPWAGAQWPKLTEVADATGVSVHPLGTALPLRAALLKSQGGFGQDVEAGQTRVAAKYRVVAEGIAGPVRRVLLTSQDRMVEVPSPSAEQGGDAGARPPPLRKGMLFERLIEPAGLTAGAPQDAPGRLRQFELEYWFETDDDRTETQRVLLVEPPAVMGAKVEVVPPEYVLPTAGAAGAGEARARQIDLGAGNDERAAPPAMLAGSRVRMVISLNKPVPTPTIAQKRAEWIAASLGADIARLAEADQAEAAARRTAGDHASPDGFRGEFAGDRWTLEWTLRQTVRVPVKVTDEHGITGVEESVYVVESLEDRPPTATVTEPQEDRTVLSTASVDFRGEGRDDVGLDWVALQSRLARPPTGSEGAPAEPIQEWVEATRVQGAAAGAPIADGPAGSAPGVLPTRMEGSARFDLSNLGLKAGDELWLTALAADAYRLDGTGHEPSRSPVRRLKIISAEQLVEQVWADLAGIRRSAIGLEEEQGRLVRDAQRSGEAARLERSQAGLTERVARDRQALDRVKQRIDENGLKDETLDDVLRQGQRLLDEAGKSSVAASGDLKDAAEVEQKDPGADSKAQREKAGQSQQEVRDRLGELIELLDQGEDTWAMRRAVERVLSEQRSLRERTAQAAQKTTGRDLSQLTPEERKELEQIATDQKSLSQKAAEAIQRMVDAQPQMQKKDPAGADALSEAARRGQRDQVPQRMEQAGQQVQQNQTNSAKGQQDRAIESLEQMLQSLQNAAKNRDEVLRRKLASLIESLEALIKEQQVQLSQLAGAREKGELSGVDKGMARLHQNSLGVLDEASQGPRELAPVAELIAAAGEAQSFAVVALRAVPTNPDEAQGQETISLEKLKEAKETAERLDREAANRQTARKRAELKKAYTEALTEQMEIRDQTEPLVGAEATRRTRATALSLGERQGTLQDSLVRLESQTMDLSDTVLFSYAHKRLDDAMGKASRDLSGGEPDRDVTWNQDRAIRVLRSLVQALDDSQKKDQEFRNQQQQSGGGNQGGGQAPLVPPMAEIKLLKAMQEEAADLTRELGGDTAAPTEHVEAVGRLQRDLADHAATLIKKLAERPGGPHPAPAGQPPDQPGGGDPPPGPPKPPPGQGDAG